MSEVVIEGYIGHHYHDPRYGQVVVSGNHIERVEFDLNKFVKANYTFDKVNEGGLPVQFVNPGGVDLHTHLRSDSSGLQNFQEDLNSYQKSAGRGGVTATCVMPNNPNQPITREEWQEYVDFTSEAKMIIIPLMGLGSGSYPPGKDVMLKLYPSETTGTGNKLTFKTQDEMDSFIFKLGGYYVTIHCEDDDILNASKNERTHSRRRPVAAVDNSVHRWTKFGLVHGLNVKIAHFTNGHQLNYIRSMKEKYAEKGLELTVEVSPHQLYFHDQMLEDHPEWAPFAQMNPALRDLESKMLLVEGARDGTIDFGASDSAPHPLFRKLMNFYDGELPKDPSKLTDEEVIELNQKVREAYENKKANLSPEKFAEIAHMNGVSGTPQQDTIGETQAWLMDEHGFTLQQVIRLFAYNPGKYLSRFIEHNIGKIKEGYLANLAVLDIDRPHVVEREDLGTKSGWCMYEVVGAEMPGQNIFTMSQGEVVFEV